MKIKKVFLLMGVPAFCLLAFMLGRYSATNHNNTQRSSDFSTAIPVPVAGTTRLSTELETPKTYPAIPRVPSKDFIRHRGDPSDDHMQMFAGALKGIALTPLEIDQLQDVYSAVYAARIDYEASVARVAVISPLETLIEIPNYSAFGEQLKKSAYGMFSDILGTTKAQAVIRQLESRIAATNGQWGAYSQSILAVYNPETKGYNIRHLINPDPTKPADFSIAAEHRLRPDRLLQYSKFRHLFPKAE